MKILLYLLLLTTYVAFTQNKPIDESLITGKVENLDKDTLFHKYNFVEGDTLEYRLESGDSVLVNWDSPLIKERYERIIITCDSVDEKTGHFFLTHEYDLITGKEFKNLYPEKEIDFHQWLNKKVTIEIDSIGKRYSFKYHDSTSSGSTAGGPFQGLIIQPIGQKSSILESSWIELNDTTKYAENSYPAPTMIRTDLFENKGNTDTLDYEVVRVDISFTGNGEFFIHDKEASFYISSLTNGHSENYISTELGIPIWAYYTQEQQFEVNYGGEKTSKGMHFTYTLFELDKFVPGKARKKTDDN
jgi:hypothetical protein